MFGILSNRLCDIFQSTLDYLFHRFTEKCQTITTWLPFSPDFCAAMRDYGSPYAANLIGLLDGNFMKTSRPCGLGNKYFCLDQLAWAWPARTRLACLAQTRLPVARLARLARRPFFLRRLWFLIICSLGSGSWSEEGYLFWSLISNGPRAVKHERFCLISEM